MTQEWPGTGLESASMTSLDISTDKARLDLELIYRYLSEESTWAIGLPRATFETSIEHSLCFGVYLDGQQVGFARVVSDFATFGNLVDVFVLSSCRGRGYSKLLMETVLSHPKLQGLRRMTLATGDAHGLYAQFGFTPPARPHSLMERYFPDIYKQ
jgi:GNAT superfamily N-acetyltransferase